MPITTWAAAMIYYYILLRDKRHHRARACYIHYKASRACFMRAAVSHMMLMIELHDTAFSSFFMPCYILRTLAPRAFAER